MTLILSLLAAVAVWLLVCLAFWAGFAAAGRALPRPIGRHRADWHYDRDDDDESPSPLPAGVDGYALGGRR